MTKNTVETHSAVKNVLLTNYIFTVLALPLLSGSGSIMAARSGKPLPGLTDLYCRSYLLVLTGIIWAEFLFFSSLK
ncbi:hypothetical protein AAHH67_17230 [Niallia circulans]|uniref:hypothetical protein n=1 Tax=Niallia circulans TaxID=1397 RepID=UPI002E1BA41C|nr:hypothetical protein [Niallia circulans]